jgi:formylglycine-generating enzyme required for sulfatase activity
VKKGGFLAWTCDVEVASGKFGPIRVRLEPVKAASVPPEQPQHPSSPVVEPPEQPKGPPLPAAKPPEPPKEPASGVIDPPEMAKEPVPPLVVVEKRERPALLDCTRPQGASPAEVRRAQEAWARYLGRQVEETIEIAPGVKMTFVLVPPGKFLMGSLEGEADHREGKVLHEVTLTEPFDLGKTEVTQAQYKALGLENPSRFKGDVLPVETVSWEEARDWAEELTTRRGDRHRYRLPTEAEWEYSCRGGRPSSQPFGIGNGRALSPHEANVNGSPPYGDAARGKGKGKDFVHTRAVASYPANAFGLHDMHGNVGEWCQDREGPYPRGSVTNPTGPEEERSLDWYRIIRGGWFSLSSRACSAAMRSWRMPRERADCLGFRVARSVPAGAN